MWFSYDYEAEIYCHLSAMIAKSTDLQNFRALGKPQAELCLLKFEKLDVCIRPLFANPVTYSYSYSYLLRTCIASHSNM